MEEKTFTLEEIELAILTCPKFKIHITADPCKDGDKDNDIDSIEPRFLLYRLIVRKYGQTEFYKYYNEKIKPK